MKARNYSHHCCHSLCQSRESMQRFRHVMRRCLFHPTEFWERHSADSNSLWSMPSRFCGGKLNMLATKRRARVGIEEVKLTSHKSALLPTCYDWLIGSHHVEWLAVSFILFQTAKTVQTSKQVPNSLLLMMPNTLLQYLRHHLPHSFETNCWFHCSLLHWLLGGENVSEHVIDCLVSMFRHCKRIPCQKKHTIE